MTHAELLDYLLEAGFGFWGKEIFRKTLSDRVLWVDLIEPTYVWSSRTSRDPRANILILYFTSRVELEEALIHESLRED